MPLGPAGASGGTRERPPGISFPIPVRQRKVRCRTGVYGWMVPADSAESRLPLRVGLSSEDRFQPSANIRIFAEIVVMVDFDKVPSPCFVLDERLLRRNLAVIDKVRRAAGVEIIVALKACAMWRIFPLLREHSDGATASSVAEARLVLEEYGSRAHTYAPVYTENDFPEIMRCSDHITFNSLGQWERFGARALLNGISCGLRVNPAYSTVATDLYNPASPDSRLGIPAADLPRLPEGVEGLHFHTLCESRPADLRATLGAFEERFGHLLPQVRWVNMGGGHLMTAEDYDEEELIDILRGFRARYPHLRIILEPGSAFTWRTGWLLRQWRILSAMAG